MDLAQYAPVVTGLVDAESHNADFERRVELDLGDAADVKVRDDEEVVREFFELAELWSFQIGVLVQDLNGRVQKPGKFMMSLKAA